MIPQDVLETVQFVSNLLLIGLVPALLYAYYRFLPLVGAKLTQGFLSGFFTKSKMTDLSVKGVEARQIQRAEASQKALILGAVAATDPLKAFAAPMLEAFVSGIVDSFELPKITKEGIKQQLTAGIPTALANSRVNFTQWAMQSIDTKFPQLKLRENLNALGVVTSAEKIE